MNRRAAAYPDFLNLERHYTSEQLLLMREVRDFLQKEIKDQIKKYYIEENFPEELILKFGELGLLGSNLNGYGLPDLDNTSYGLVMRELERIDSGLRSFASVQGSLVMFPIYAYGSEAQKEKWLPLLGSGKAVGCFGLTEADGGSDPGAMKTTAKKQGSEWILNGSKMWITNGNLAQVAIVWAKTAEGIRGFVVPTNIKGFTVKKMTHKLSLRASVTSELFFDNVKLSEDSLLPHAEGLKAALGCLSQARYGIAWGVLGAAEACYDEALNFSKTRILFGQSLSTKQIVQWKLAKILTDITHGQLLALELSKLKNEGKLHFTQISMGKQANCEMALSVARRCRDILGANGITHEYETMRHMCNLETVITYEGTNDIHLLILGQELSGTPSF